MKIDRRSLLAMSLMSAAACSIGAISERANAASAEDLDRSSAQALQTLFRTHPVAADIGKTAKAGLVFPNIVKAGLIFGGSYGEGVLMNDPKVVDYYNSVSGCWGLQAGAQSYGYALFLMNDKALS